MDPQFLLLSGAIVSLKIVTLLALLWAPTAAALKLLAFGDSILDTGNTLFLPPKAWQPEANWAPYGRELVPPGPTGRFSDGHLITDFIGQWTRATAPGRKRPSTGVAPLPGSSQQGIARILVESSLYRCCEFS